MQDRYAGDVGDFSKYAILRALVSATGWRCGIVWYLYPCESHTNDGKFVDYAHRPEFRNCDPDALDLLAKVATGPRSVAALESAGLLPATTVHFSERFLPGVEREAWFDRAKAAVQGCDLVMVDPDNGIANDATYRPLSQKSGKHITLREVAELAARCQCLVVYHHFSRQGSHEEQIQRWLRTLSDTVPEAVRPFALRYERFSPRAYFVLPMSAPSSDHARSVAASLTAGPWAKQFRAFDSAS